VGISPGHTADVAIVDLSNGSGSGGAAIAERFAQQSSIDTFAVAQKFYQTHPDNYDQILLWTDQSLIRDAFAYELTVANEVRGIGVDLFDLSRSLGSGGRVRSLVVMDWIGKYPDNPQERFLGENNTLSVLGQEVGHRWGAYLEFRDHTGQRSDALLGRDLAHWSFHFDSDASVLEGNDIEDLGGGQFRTTASHLRARGATSSSTTSLRSTARGSRRQPTRRGCIGRRSSISSAPVEPRTPRKSLSWIASGRSGSPSFRWRPRAA
jgi:hypothetical protein